MPAKYHIHSQPMPPRHKPIGKYGIVDWREDCCTCHNCVKRECIYSVYNDERDRLQTRVDYVDYLYECKGCLCCVQSCTKGLLSWQVNPEYAAMGDDVWTPDIISTSWYQADTGSVPVSGAGYPGPFKGPGFDAILTDMSEIVRPTRDGIHGREYISTQVDIGRKPMKLEFDADGALVTYCPPLVELPLPVIFSTMPWHKLTPSVDQAIMEAAKKLGTMVTTADPASVKNPAAIPLDAPASDLGGAAIAEWQDAPDVIDKISKARAVSPDLVAIVKLPLGSSMIPRCLELASQGVEVLHVCADWRGAVAEQDGTKHITDAVRDLHLAFTQHGNRDEITIIAGGGISLAEHVVKTIICGADLVAIDVPVAVALECRICGNCREGLACPAGIDEVDSEYAVQRIVNLMSAWHSQMLEMMGAMGIREARRLRGEVGRAMFFRDLEKECFAPIFGNLKAEVS